MRLVLLVMIVLLFAGAVMLWVSNPGTRVTVTLWSSQYDDVHIVSVIIVSMIVGALLMGILAVAEGTKARLENMRLRREIQRLGTEIGYLRTQPPQSGRAEPDALDAGEDESPRSPGQSTHSSLAAAPIYGSDADDWTDDPDDEPYGGGRLDRG